MTVVYLNGAFLPEEEATLPISDRGFQFGDGAFATIRVQDGKPRFLEVHLKRLEEQCQTLGILFSQVDPAVIEELILLNHAEEGVWRLKIIVTGGDHPAMRLPSRRGRLLIFLKPFDPPPRKVLKLGIFPTPFYLCHASFKSLAHLNRYYVLEEAARQGVDDCVTLTEKGILLEAAFGNLFWIQGQTLYTPSPDLPLYFGVTITTVVKIAEELGFSVEKVETPLEELSREAFYFRTNTMHEICPVKQIGELCFSTDEELEQTFVTRYKKSGTFESAALSRSV